MTVTRREFVKRGAMGATLSFFAPALFTRSALAADPNQKMLVVVQLSGGNDAVNTFIPYTDPLYRTLRPTLAIPDAQILKIDSLVGFHPAMARLKTLYDQKKFAFVPNVGFPTLDRSHFHCMDVWHTADEMVGHAHAGGDTGWLGRYADLYVTQGATPLTNVSISYANPLGYSSNRVIPIATPSAASFDVATESNDRTAFMAALRNSYAAAQSGQPESIRKEGVETLAAIDLLKTIPPVTTSVVYPNNGLGTAFKFAAQIAAGNIGTHAVWINTGGYDTHSAQAAGHNNLLTNVSECLGAFLDDLTARGIADKVLVVGFSEFGRRLAENGSAGTDHGKAGAMFLMGSKLKGGAMYGDPPSMSDGVNGDLRTKVDFRSVYATIIKDWFGKDPFPVLNGNYANLGFLETGSIGCNPAYGDLNKDGLVNTIDSVIMANHLAGNINPGTPPFTAQQLYGDVNDSGGINVADHVVLNNHLAGNITCLPKK